jgi:hypothetical protein
MTNRRQAFEAQRQAARATDARIKAKSSAARYRASNLFSPRTTLPGMAASPAEEGHERSPQVVSLTFPTAEASFGGRAAGASNG